jgi:hypothetical protein
LFAPATNSLAPAPPMPLSAVNPGAGRGYHGASRLPNGDVLVTGGAASIGLSGEAAATNECVRFDGTNWVAAAPLLEGVAFHAQVVDPATGNALLMGGFTGTFGFAPSSAQAGIHDGTTFSSLRALGTHGFLTAQAASPRAGMSCTPLQDGTTLVWGGQSPNVLVITTYADGYVYAR